MYAFFDVIRRFIIGTSMIAFLSAAVVPSLTGQQITDSASRLTAAASRNQTQNQTSNLPIQATTNSSLNWSGYAATTGNFTAVSGTWTVPEAKPGQTGNISADAAWVGIGGVLTHDLIQAGTQAIAYESGKVQYQAWYETLPQVSQPIPLSIKPGDSVTVTLTQTNSAEWSLVFNNDTTNRNFSTTLNYRSSLSSAEWMEEMPSTIANNFIPLNNFGTINFTSGWAMKDGDKVNIRDSSAQAVSMNDGYGNLLAAPSVFNSTGTGFSVVQAENLPNSAISSNTSPFEFSSIPGVVPGYSYHRHHRQFTITIVR
ncbi:MAG: G1 family glutamic endopeptidase [Acidobacteriaceae bacterium]